MKYILATVFLSFMFSCSTTTCKPNETTDAANSKQAVAGETTVSPTTTMTNQIKKIKIYKPDGSVQCEQGSGTSAADMQKQLGDIKAYSAETKSDGLIRIQVCGQPTGNCNVYEINETDFAKASTLGFKKWKNN
jgi:hypothetical protein